MTNIPKDVQIGDFFVVSGGIHSGPLIEFFEQIDKQDIPDEFLEKATLFQHAGLISDIGKDNVMVLEEEGRGMVEVPYHYEDAIIMFSTWALHPANRFEIIQHARSLKGHRYGWLTYAALTAHHYHIWVPGLKRFIDWSGDEICSQSVDDSWTKAGNHIFDDGRWPGDVKPSDLAYKLLSLGAQPIYPER